MSEQNELKSCPFCGGEALMQEHPAHTHLIATFMPDHEGSWTIECSQCCAGMIDSTKDEVIAIWNRRVADEPKQESVAWACWLDGHPQTLKLMQLSSSEPLAYPQRRPLGFLPVAGAEPVAWLMITPNQKNHIILWDKAEVERYKAMGDRVVQALYTATPAPQDNRDIERYRWLASRVLACDHGDNDAPGRQIGWRICHDLLPMNGGRQPALMYGPSINDAIDAAIAAALKELTT